MWYASEIPPDSARHHTVDSKTFDAYHILPLRCWFFPGGGTFWMKVFPAITECCCWYLWSVSANRWPCIVLAAVIAVSTVAFRSKLHLQSWSFKSVPPVHLLYWITQTGLRVSCVHVAHNNCTVLPNKATVIVAVAKTVTLVFILHETAASAIALSLSHLSLSFLTPWS
jgi:hypothetical protein